jgi:O-antigen biosynthesis alpha-1,2-rhamnosyltransferase
MQSNAAVPNRILIECTDTVVAGVNTGIQRVVRSLVREGVRIGRERGQAIIGVVAGVSGFEEYVLGSESEADPPRALRYNVLYYAPKAYLRAAEWLCRWIKSRKIRALLLPKPGHLGLFRPAVRILEMIQSFAGRSPGGTVLARSDLRLRAGDMLILPDGYWGRAEIWKYVRAARKQGAFVAVIIPDLIPLTHSSLVPSKFPARFRKYVLDAASNSDLIMAYSQTIRDELRQKLPKLLPELSIIPPVEAFCNGADFEDHEGEVRDELVPVFSPPGGRPPPYLSVSTFSPRKNHGFTLAAFEILWSRGIDARLMFVGGRGWISNDLLSRIERHQEFGKRLLMYHDLSDAELNYCYQRARGTISASFVEGFNLPIVESLWHGRKTFASDTPIHREVGGQHAEYFSLSSPECLAEAIARFEGELACGAEVGQCRIKPMSWRESTALLLERCCAAYSSAKQGNNPGQWTATHRKATSVSTSTRRAA